MDCQCRDNWPRPSHYDHNFIQCWPNSPRCRKGSSWDKAVLLSQSEWDLCMVEIPATPSRAPGNETDTNSQEGEIKHSSITDDSKNESLVTLKKTFIQLDVILFSVGTQWAIKIKMNLGNETAVWEMFAKKLFHYFLKRQMVLQFDTRLRPQMFLKWKGPTSHMEVPSTCVSECGESLRINVLMFL